MIVAPRDALGVAGRGRRCRAPRRCWSWPASSRARRCIARVVLASTSGTQGTAGRASGWPRTLAGPIDAVIVLGDLAARHRPAAGDRPVVDGQVARARRRCATRVAAALARAGVARPTLTGLGGQFAHLAFPFTISASRARSAPRASRRWSSRCPASRAPRRTPAIDRTRPSSPTMGRAVLATISALDGGPDARAAVGLRPARRQGRPGLGDPRCSCCR